MFLPKVEVKKVARLSGFSIYELVKNYRGGEGNLYKKNKKAKALCVGIWL